MTVVTNDRAVPISVGMTSPTGRGLTVSLDEDFGYERTKVRRDGARALSGDLRSCIDGER